MAHSNTVLVSSWNAWKKAEAALDEVIKELELTMPDLAESLEGHFDFWKMALMQREQLTDAFEWDMTKLYSVSEEVKTRLMEAVARLPELPLELPPDF